MTLDGLPIERPPGCPFDPPAELAQVRPLTRMTYPNGHQGWLATGYTATREVLADRRFSSRFEVMHYPLPGLEHLDSLPPASIGDLTGMDPPEHTRYRKLLIGKFTVRRMRQLAARVAEITSEHLAAMERQGPGVDLVQAYAHPIPSVVICELLGVPYADRDTFQRHASAVFSSDATPEEQGAAYGELGKYMQGLVVTKRTTPTDDLLSDLTTTDLTDDELTGVGTFLLAAGLDTTANMLSLSAFALLREPSHLPHLHAEPDRATEELLRYLSIAHTGVRTALEDVDLADHRISAGESVTVSIQSANRDPLKYPDPNTLDLTRAATGHLAFGHGIHQCLGQQLARVEMRIALPALFTRFPTLRLAVPPEQVPLRPPHQNIYGVRALPVTW